MKHQRKIGIVFALAIMVSLFMMPNVFAETSDDWGNLQVRLGQSGKTTLDKDYTAGDEDTALEVPADVDITIDLNGHTIDRGLANATAKEGGNVITVKGSLTIEDSKGGGKITGGHSFDKGGGIYVDGGSLTMDGGSITGNKVELYVSNYNCLGGGICVDSGSLTMNAGTISNNQAIAEDDDNSYGGGVFASGNNFYMKGGTISGNNAMYGGGVYVDGINFDMSNGTISGNTADYGGGIGIDDKASECTLAGGTISNNTANEYGGGVYSEDSFTMNGGTISNNTAKNGGGGVYVKDPFSSPEDTFYMKGGTISNNSAESEEGGGVYINTGALELSGGKISDNFTPLDGGGVYLASSTFEMSNGEISNNSAEKNGGGVYLANSDFEMSNGEISNNRATKCGGGVGLTSGDITMKGGNISNNTANEGGGVYYYGDSTDYFEMSAGEISNNHAYSVNESGGGVFLRDGNLLLTGGNINDNDADGDGGGVYLFVGSLELTGGTINDNKAGGEGGGVFFLSGTFYLSDSPDISGNKKEETDNNVHIVSPNLISIDGPLKNTTKIGISMDNSGVFTKYYKDEMGAADPKQYFKTDKAGYGIKLYDYEEPQYEGEVMLHPTQTYTVTFLDGLGKTLKQEVVEEGDAAVAPAAPTRSGYVFGGWDKDISKVTSDMMVTAVWKISIDKAPVALSSAALTYNSKVLKPAIKTIGGKVLKAGTDYTAAWSNASSKNVGAYTVKITGKGTYTGTTQASYQIVPKGAKIKSLKKAKKAVTVKWKKQAAKMPKKRINGYQIQLATDKQFAKNCKTVTVKGYKKASKKVTRLKGGKKYFVRMRTYQSVGGKKYYSTWSKVKSVKVRK